MNIMCDIAFYGHVFVLTLQHVSRVESVRFMDNDYLNLADVYFELIIAQQLCMQLY